MWQLKENTVKNEENIGNLEVNITLKETYSNIKQIIIKIYLKETYLQVLI